MYNRQLRHARQLLALVKSTSSTGYFTVSSSNLSTLASAELAQVVGVYKSKTDLKRTLSALAHDHYLCPKLLHLESGSGSCFNYQLNRCHGACLDKESPLAYNLRFVQAFSASSLSTWPFSGPIVIKEADSFHLFNNWSYLGHYIDSDSLTSPEFPPAFDLDTYKILKRFIINPAHQSLIHPL